MVTGLSPALNRNLGGGAVSNFSSLLQLEAQELASRKAYKARYMFAVGTGKACQGDLVHSSASAASSGILHTVTLSTRFTPWRLSLHSLIPFQQAPLADQVLVHNHGHLSCTHGNVPTALNSKHFSGLGTKAGCGGLLPPWQNSLWFQQWFIHWACCQFHCLPFISGAQ